MRRQLASDERPGEDGCERGPGAGTGPERAQAEEGELPLVGQIAREGHDHLAGQGDAGAFDGH